jgi:hypothetical protein
MGETRAMKGLELARRYYLEVGRPMLEREFPEYLPRIAAGLVGDGSECLGYDDAISQDHDFGPGFCLWLSKEDYEAAGARMQEMYQRLPGSFLGFPARNTSARGDGRVGVFQIFEFYRRFIGNEQPPADLMRWLYLPEDKLAILASGEVFEDGAGQFSEIRDVIRAYYPEDVRIKKIAARAASMAQSGQYNYGRCMRRGDIVAASMALSEFIKHALAMIYLLNRRYAPYYKWSFRGLADLPMLAGAAPLLRELAGLGDQSSAWEEPHPEHWNPYVNMLDKKVERIERICRMVTEELNRQGLTDRDDDFLEAHTGELMGRIQDPVLRGCHVLEGIT